MDDRLFGRPIHGQPALPGSKNPKVGVNQTPPTHHVKRAFGSPFSTGRPAPPGENSSSAGRSTALLPADSLQQNKQQLISIYMVGPTRRSQHQYKIFRCPPPRKRETSKHTGQNIIIMMMMERQLRIDGMSRTCKQRKKKKKKLPLITYLIIKI